MVYLSGEIPRITPFERGFPDQYRQMLDGDGWEPDELVMDERFVAVDVAGKGLVIFTACSHAGAINVLKHAPETFRDLPVHAIVGGLHLAGANERIIPDSVEAMREFDPAYIVAGHCTGWRAIAALANAFGEDKLIPLSVGKLVALVSRGGEQPQLLRARTIS
jgi:7,8-dihydropterin-6-yl-methyl-4-(beta-D-ribofuranosyl)aminobenzene 5'-phosphate synthase